MKLLTLPHCPLVVLTTLFTLVRLWLLIPILLCGSQMTNNNDINNVLDSLLFMQENNYKYKDSMQRTMMFEEYREKPYLDSSGFPTIGIGNKLESVSYKKGQIPEKYSNMSVSKVDAVKNYIDNYFEIQNVVKKKYGKDFDKLSTEAQGVITDLAYNLGAFKLFNEFPGFIEDFKKGDYDEAAKELKFVNPDEGNMDISKYWKQIGALNTENKNLKRSDNRGTSAYDILLSLTNE